MFCVVVWWADRSGIVMIMGPWRTDVEALAAADALEPFAMGKIFDVRPMSPVILPATVQ